MVHRHSKRMVVMAKLLVLLALLAVSACSSASCYERKDGGITVCGGL